MDLESLTTRATEMMLTWGWTLLSTVAIALVGYFVIGFVRRLVVSFLDRSPLDPTATRFMSDFARWILLALLAVAVAGNLGIETSSFVALLGCLGLAGGMAMEGTLSNFASGLLLAVFKPFEVGDFIQIGDHEGEVVDIDIVTTQLRTLDFETIIVPNSEAAGSAVTNFSRHPFVRIEVGFTVAFETELDLVEPALLQAATRCPRVIDEPAAELQVCGFSDTGLMLQIEVSVLPHDREDAGFELARAIHSTLREAQVGPPTRTVRHLPSPTA